MNCVLPYYNIDIEGYIMDIFQMRYNFISLHDKIRRKEQALQFAQDHGLIKSSASCNKCHLKFSVQHTRAESNYVFFTCTSCHTKESIRKDTFLYNKVWIFMLYFCSCNFCQVMYFPRLSYIISRTLPSSPSYCLLSSSVKCRTWPFFRFLFRFLWNFIFYEFLLKFSFYNWVIS